MTGVQERATSQRRRVGRAPSRKAVGSSTRSSRGGGQTAEQALSELEPMISALIKENRRLHREIDKLSRQTVGAASAPMERTLRSLERRVRGSLDGRSTTGRKRSGDPSNSRARRKVTDPELLERRRQALAKAREARAARRAGAH
jgi:hypothetical protein